MSWSFTFFSGWERIEDDAFLSQWTTAFENEVRMRASPYCHPVLFWSWAKAYGADCFEPLGYIGRHSDGRQVIQVLKRDKPGTGSGMIRPFRAVGYDFFDFTEPVIISEGDVALTIGTDFWGALWDALRSDAALNAETAVVGLDVPRVRGTTLKHFPPSGEVERSLYLDLTPYDGFDAYMKSRSGNFRRQLRRRTKRLQEQGAVTLRHYTADEIDDVKQWIPKLVHEQHEKYDLRFGPDAFEKFLNCLVETGVPAGLVKPSAICLDGTPISWSIDFHLNGVLYLYAGSFDPEFDIYSLGNLHIMFLLEQAFERNDTCLDFLWGDEPYKLKWTDGGQELLHPVSFKTKDPISLLMRMADKGMRQVGLL